MEEQERFRPVFAWPGEDTSTSNRVNEARQAIAFDVAGIVDESVGGVIAYAHVDYVDEFCDLLNRPIEITHPSVTKPE